MSVTFRAQASANAVSGGNPSLVIPVSVAVDDVMLLWCVIQNNTSTAATPAGWTSLGSQQGANDGITYLWWKKASASDATTNLTVNLSIGGTTPKSNIVLVAYSAASAYYDPPVAKSSEAIDRTTHTTPNLTGFFEGAMIVECVSDRAVTSTTSWTIPNGFTKRSESYSTGASSPTIVIADKVAVNSGSYGNDNFVADQTSINATMWTVNIAAKRAEYVLVSGVWKPSISVRLSGSTWS